MGVNFDKLINGAFEHGVSDVHLAPDSPVYFRRDGVMIEVPGAELAKDELDSFMSRVMPERAAQALEEKRGADFSWQPDDRMRFRVSAYYERERLRLVMRLVKMKILTLEDLELPEVLHTIAGWHRGLVLVTGVTGSGKSTTLAAIVHEINLRERRCIITLEDPIEMVHPNIKSVISQREVGRDIVSFREGLVQALRQDPDVILIGEMRDAETIQTSLRAAETGHFVLSTMHTTNALHTIERIMAEFPETEHRLLREQLANNLKATITQRLVKRAGGKGRAAALEILIVNDVVRKLMLEDRIPSIGTVIRERKDGMILFDQHLADLVRDEIVGEADAEAHVEDEFAFRRYLKGKASSADRGGILG